MGSVVILVLVDDGGCGRDRVIDADGRRRRVDACGRGTVVDHGDGWIVVPGGCHRHRLRWWWDHIAGVVGVRVIVVVFVDVGHGCRRL